MSHLSQSPSSMSPNDIIQLQPALQRLGNDIELLRALAGFFVDDAGPLLKSIQAGCEDGDAELVTRSAHSLKGLASNFDAVRAVAIAAQLESAGREGKLAEAQQGLPQLTSAVAEVVEALNQQVLRTPGGG